MFHYTPSKEVIDQLTLLTGGEEKEIEDFHKQYGEYVGCTVRRFFATLAGNREGRVPTIATLEKTLSPEVQTGLQVRLGLDELGINDSIAVQSLMTQFGKEICEALDNDNRITTEVYSFRDHRGYRLYQGPEII